MNIRRPTYGLLALVTCVAACGSPADVDQPSSETQEPSVATDIQNSTLEPISSDSLASAPADPPDASGPAVSATDTPADSTDSVSAPPVDAVAAPICWTNAPATGTGIDFEQSTGQFGLIEPLAGMYGHAVAAGDVNGDTWTDLFVAGFADRPNEEYAVRGATGPSPERLLLGSESGFALDPTFPGELARTSGATMVDLDADGDLDLVAVRNPRRKTEIQSRSTVVYEQVDGGWKIGQPLLSGVAGRSVAAPDIDRDGLPDLLVVADRFGGGSTRLLHNDGGLRFSDVTEQWGVPDDMTGLALATVDLDLDGWSDVVVSGEPRVLMGGPGGFDVDVHEELRFEVFGNEDDPAGIAVGDLNGDGRPDLVIGHHFNSTVDAGKQVPVRLFVNREASGGFTLDDVTVASGSPGLATKSPHVGIVDLDNDGVVDIVTSAISSSGAPIVLRGVGPDADGIPMVETIGQPGDGEYFVTGIEEDLDRDGRVDVFQVAWPPSDASQLFVNASTSGHWLQVDLTSLPGGHDDVRVEVLDTETGEMLALGWSGSTTGYAAGPTSVVHLGLGDTVAEDLAVRVIPAWANADEVVLAATIDSRITVGGC